jgi:hypothetical protein
MTLAPARVRYLTTTVSALPLSAALPVLVHLLPVTGGTPAGARPLPIFFAPLIAALLGRPAAALTAALLAPVLNHFLTGMPAAASLPNSTMQLLVFTGVAVLLALPRRPLLALLAPLAYLIAYYLSPPLLTLLAALPGLDPLAGGSTRPLMSVLNSAWPGLLALLAVGWAMSRKQPRRQVPGQPRAQAGKRSGKQSGR